MGTSSAIMGRGITTGQKEDAVRVQHWEQLITALKPPPVLTLCGHTSSSVKVKIRSQTPVNSNAFAQKVKEYFSLMSYILSSLSVTKESNKDTAKKRQQNVSVYHSTRTTEITKTWWTFKQAF